MSGISRLLRPLQQRLQLMVGRCLVLLVDDDTRLQSLQVALLAEEVRGDVERFQQYGFTSHPHPDAEAIAVAVGGNRDHCVVLSVDDRRYRLKGLAQGEVALYTDEGDRVVLRRGGIVEVHAGAELRVTAPLCTMSGDLQVQGSIDSGATITAAEDVRDQGGAKTMAGMRSVYNGHTHGASPTRSASM